MAEQTVYIGSAGPFIFDDSDTYEDGYNHAAIHTLTGKATVGAGPTDPDDVLRLSDVTSILEESKRYALLVG